MTENNPTPFDRGTRLEPQLWPVGQEVDSYGRVDFDNEESRTVLTAYVEREGDGYALHVDGLSEPLSVVVDGGGRVVPIGVELVEGIEELLAMAHRGRADWLRQAHHPDYTDEDREAAKRRWIIAHEVALLLAGEAQKG